jgi:hypothetical protein
MPASSMILVSEANEEADKAARVKAVYESQARPLPKPKKRVVHGRPTTIDVSVVDGSPSERVEAVWSLSTRLANAMRDLNLAYVSGGEIRNTAMARHGYKTVEIADDAVVLAHALAEAVAVAFPRGPVEPE